MLKGNYISFLAIFNKYWQKFYIYYDRNFILTILPKMLEILRASSAILAVPPNDGKCSSSEKFTFVLLNKLKNKVELTPF